MSVVENSINLKEKILENDSRISAYVLVYLSSIGLLKQDDVLMYGASSRRSPRDTVGLSLIDKIVHCFTTECESATYIVG